MDLKTVGLDTPSLFALVTTSFKVLADVKNFLLFGVKAIHPLFFLFNNLLRSTGFIILLYFSLPNMSNVMFYLNGYERIFD